MARHYKCAAVTAAVACLLQFTQSASCSCYRCYCSDLRKHKNVTQLFVGVVFGVPFIFVISPGRQTSSSRSAREQRGCPNETDRRRASSWLLCEISKFHYGQTHVYMYVHTFAFIFIFTYAHTYISSYDVVES